MNIVLTGFMGTGKTAVGKKTAKALNMQYIDTDEVIEKDVGRKIHRIFEDSGEKYFRGIEAKVVKCVALLDGFVISTGGGVVLKKENMKELEKNGMVICLAASPEVILKRTRSAIYRPLLNVNDPAGKIKELLEKRAPFYKRCSLMIDTSGKSIEEVSVDIISFARQAGKNSQ